VVARARFTTSEVDPFGFVGIVAPRVSATARMDPVTPKQRALLLRNDVPNVDRLCKREASAIIDKILGKPSEAQVWFLRKHGQDPTGLSRAEASRLISRLKGETTGALPAATA